MPAKNNFGEANEVVMADDLQAEEATLLEASQADLPPGKRSRLISRVLAQAVSWWLRSQLEHVEDLQFSIDAGDRQLLSGQIHQVAASASRAVYRGLHLSQIQVTGREIQTNLRQMLRGKAFRLLAAFPVYGEISLSEADLNASLAAPLLANAVTDFLCMLLQAEVPALAVEAGQSVHLNDAKAVLAADKIALSGCLVTDQMAIPLTLSAQLSVKNGNVLKLQAIDCVRHGADGAEAIAVPRSLVFPLGSEVKLEEFAITDGKLVCRGEITVTPTAPSTP